MDLIFLIKALQLILSLSILVVLHEFGHYIPAKLFGCRVEKFYLFIDYPFALFKKKLFGTEFGVGVLHLEVTLKFQGLLMKVLIQIIQMMNQKNGNLDLNLHGKD